MNRFREPRCVHALQVLIVVFASLSLPTMTLGDVVAESPQSTQAPAVQAPSVSQNRSSVEPSTESAALELVREQLPALNEVLDRLRFSAPQQYEKAVRDIAKSAKRLEVTRHRDEKLYLIELELLKARTTTSLLVARLKIRDSNTDRKSLRESIEKLRAVELGRARYEVETLEKRLARTTEQLNSARDRLNRKSNELNERSETVYAEYLRKAGRSPTAAASRKRSSGSVESK